MYRQIVVALAFLATAPAWSQVQPAAAGDLAPIDDQTQMAPPPLVSGVIYPAVAGAEEKSNFVAGSIRTEGAYTDNILPATTAKPIADETVTILPEFSVNQKSSRQKLAFIYDPTFTFYKNSDTLNAFGQTATADFERRLSPHIAIGLQDYFVKTSNVFSAQYPFVAGGLGGGAQTPVPAVIAPFAEQIRNVANANLSYQFSSKGMIGAGGQFANYRFPNVAQATDLYNSDSSGGEAFYERRLTRTQYVGFMYQYTRVLNYPPNLTVESQMHTVLPFYMLSFGRGFSLSVSGGAQKTNVSETKLPTFSAWTPASFVSFGWQGGRGHLATTYLHDSVAGEGLLGAFHSNSFNVDGGLKFSRSWNGLAAFSYQNTNAVKSAIKLDYAGGKTMTAMAALEHSIGEQFSLEFGYNRLHQEFNGLAIISANPDSNREFLRIAYTFTKSLGR